MSKIAAAARRAWANKAVRDSVLAALATLVGAASIYFQTPAYAVVYVVVRAGIAAWIQRASGGDVTVPDAAP